MRDNIGIVTTKRTVLRTGFGVVIGLLFLSTITAYRIQDSFSKQTVEIHHRYVHQQEVITNLRRNLWQSGIIARDFFLNVNANKSQTYLMQLEKLEQETSGFFQEMRRLRHGDRAVDDLKAKFDDTFQVLRSSAAAGLDESQEYAFVQEQIVPRRDAASVLLRQLERANENSLTESEEQFSATRRASLQRLLVLLGLGLLVGIMVTAFSLNYSENLERQSAAHLTEVSRAKRDLEKLSARLMEIQEEERRRLSRELHDEIVQTLAVLKMEIMQVQSVANTRLPEVRENLARARDLAEQTVRTVRNITLLLRPSLLDDLGLGPALQWQTEEFKRRTGVSCELTEIGLQEDLPEAVKTCVYRVTQEALHNCEKHANATKVQVKVEQTRNLLTVEVVDDGVGFQRPLDGADLKEAAFGRLSFGILGMRERAASLGGKLHMFSSPGHGARVMLELPGQSITSDELTARPAVASV